MNDYVVLVLNEVRKWVDAFSHAPIERKQQFVYDLYSDGWKDLNDCRKGGRLSLVDGRWTKVSRMELDTLFVSEHYKRIKQALHDKTDEKIKVLEVGAGYGKVTFPLSSLFPQAEFFAIEYTHSGPQTAKKYKSQYRHSIKQVASRIGVYHDKNSLVESFESGDAKSLQFTDKFFDLSYTNLVLEQIPNKEDHIKLLQEMKRVTKRFCCFLEPWGEAQNFFTRTYLKRIDYFHESWKMLYEIGFKNVRYYATHFHHCPRFRIGYVIAEI